MKTFFKNRANHFAMLLMALAMAFLACEEKGNTFTDARDGKKYKTVKIGEQVWMAENLNYAVAEGSKCYDSNEEFCQKYGRLYHWETAMKACPNGWHLPSEDEWKSLDFGNSETAGKKLKAKSGWNKGGNGDDTYGFAALPGGGGSPDGNCFQIGDNGYWWSSSKYDSEMVYVWKMDYDNDRAYRDSRSMYISLSVRCVQGVGGTSDGAASKAAAEEVREASEPAGPAIVHPTISEFTRECTANEAADCAAYQFRDDPNGTYYHFISYVSDGGSESDNISHEDAFTTSSTLAPQGKVRYDAANLQNNTSFGGDRSITWCEGVKGHGIGERVNMRITAQKFVLPHSENDAIWFSELMIVNGYAKNQTTFKNNSRAKILRLNVGGKHWADLHLKDVIKPQVFSLPLIESNKAGKKIAEGNPNDGIYGVTYQIDLSFEITEVYPGDKYEDTCITGIALR